MCRGVDSRMSYYFYLKDILLTGCLSERTVHNEMTYQSAEEKV